MTGNCFQVHGEMVLSRKVEDKVLVHGEVSGQQHLEGIRFGHCWLEDDHNVYDFSNEREIIMPKFVYYSLGNIVDEEGKLFKYTSEEARMMMLKHEHYGWWELTCNQ